MHTCPPPAAAIAKWLDEYLDDLGDYGHLLLEQKGALDPALAPALVPYFESAHGDAREHFCAQIGIDLHPDADHDKDAAALMYPAFLPTTARRGLFGEVLAGLVTQAFEFVGSHEWRVPIFLFRYHSAVEKYLFDLAREPDGPAAVFGRLGSDFIGLCLDDGGRVARVIVGEAKWRETLTQPVVDQLMHGKWVTHKETGARRRSGKGVWREVNRDLQNPHGLRQLQRLLEERDPVGHAAAIATLDRALALRNPVPLPRTNLILLSGNGEKNRDARTTFLPFKHKPPEYTATHDLQVVEVVLKDGELLIDQIYNALWADA